MSFQRGILCCIVLHVGICFYVAIAEDFYQLLGVKRTASVKEVKKAYRAKSLEWHPDKNKAEGAAEKFASISRAYEVLADQEKRDTYDRYGEDGLKQKEQMGEQGSSGGFDDIFSHFGFNFGGGRRRESEQRTPSIEMPLRLTLEQLYLGDSIEIEYVRQTLCLNWEECMRTNNECQGPGVKAYRQQIAPGFVQQIQQNDERCVARGKMWRSNCRECPNGQTQTEIIELSVEVNKGMRQGERISFEGVADEKPGLQAGDLHLVVVEIGSKHYHREGDHLYKTMEIPLVDALVGFKRILAHLDGAEFEIERRDITECDEVMRVPGKGMPRRSGHGYGDLYITFEIDFPDHLNAEQKGAIGRILRGSGTEEL